MALSFPRGFATDDFFGAQPSASCEWPVLPPPPPPPPAGSLSAARRRSPALTACPSCFAAAPFFTGFPDMSREFTRALAPLEGQAGTQLATRGVPIDVVSLSWCRAAAGMLQMLLLLGALLA